MEALARVGLFIVVLIVLFGVMLGGSDLLNPVDAILDVQKQLIDLEHQQEAHAQALRLAQQDAEGRAAVRAAIGAALAQGIAEVAGALAFGLGLLLGVLGTSAALASAAGILWLYRRVLQPAGQRAQAQQAAPPVPPAPHAPPVPPVPPAPVGAAQQPAPGVAHAPHVPVQQGATGNGTNGGGAVEQPPGQVIYFAAAHRNPYAGHTAAGGNGREADAGQHSKRNGTRPSYRQAEELEDQYRSQGR